jgi:hypothetical protein
MAQLHLACVRNMLFISLGHNGFCLSTPGRPSSVCRSCFQLKNLPLLVLLPIDGVWGDGSMLCSRSWSKYHASLESRRDQSRTSHHPRRHRSEEELITCGFDLCDFQAKHGTCSTIESTTSVSPRYVPMHRRNVANSPYRMKPLATVIDSRDVGAQVTQDFPLTSICY